MELIIHSFGAKLRINNGMFRVTLPDLSGLGGHTQEDIPVHEVTTILMEKRTSISTDVLLYALANNIDVILLDHFGNPAGRFLSAAPSNTLETWRRQLEVSRTAAGLRIARDWVLEKMLFQIKFFDRLASYRKGEKLAIVRRGQQYLQEGYAKLRNFTINPADLAASAQSIRGIEGIHQKAY